MKKVLLIALSALALFAAINARAATAILAGGCFWCMEADFEKLDGVSEVISGFTGGSHPNPTYNGAHTGHYEAVRITYDPTVIDYRGILEHFWINHDPFDDGGQFCDRGHEYLAAIFVADEAERKAAEQSRQEVASRFPGKTVVTPILPRSTFYPIRGDESYHQDYYLKSPVRYRYYRWGCGRDRRLAEIWGEKTAN